MKTKLVDFLYIFCISASGMSVALFLKSDIVSLFCAVLSSVVMALVFSMHPALDMTKPLNKTIFTIGTVCSSSASVFTACALFGRFVLNKTYVALVLVLSVFVITAIALSSFYAIKYTTAVMSSLCIVFLLIVLVLSIVNKDFSKAKCLDFNIKSVLPLVALSSVDSVFVIGHIKKTNRAVGIFAYVLMPVYFLVTTIVAMSTLSSKLYCNFDMPILKMWQTTYLASFVDRYETVIITALGALCLLKSGIMLKSVFEINSKKAVLVTVVFAITISVLKSFSVMYVLCAIIIFASAFLIFNSAFKKYY